MDVDPSERAGGSVGPKDASAPFNKEVGDVYLRSADDVDFRVRSAILSEASPVFEDLFLLPTPDRTQVDGTAGGGTQEFRDGIPVIPMTESSSTLDNLLRFCYPTQNPKLTTAQDICSVLEASRKYLISSVEEEILEVLKTYAAEDPLPIYAIATTRKWNEEIRLAARLSLHRQYVPGVMIPEMEYIPAGAYARLLTYRAACCRAAKNAILLDAIVHFQPSWFRSPSIPHSLALELSECHLDHPGYDESQGGWIDMQFSGSLDRLSVPDWLLKYLRSARDCVADSPSGDSIRRHYHSVHTALTESVAHSGICPECLEAKVVSDVIEEVRTILAEAVEAAVDKVELEILV